MLKKIVIKNFINFREREELQFKNGSNYIVGRNSTGKSSIFELIRRCLYRRNSKSSCSTSSIPDPDEIAFTLCKFEKNKDLELYSGVFVDRQNEGNRKIFKIVYNKTKEDGDFFSGDYVEQDEGPITLGPLQIKQDKKIVVGEYLSYILNETTQPVKETSSKKEQEIKLNKHETEISAVKKGYHSKNKQEIELHTNETELSVAKQENHSKQEQEIELHTDGIEISAAKQENETEISVAKQENHSKQKQEMELHTDVTIIYDAKQESHSKPLKERVSHVYETNISAVEEGNHSKLDKLMKVLINDSNISTVEQAFPSEDLLRDVTETFVQVFPLRSIGRLQWNKSKLITEKEENYRKGDENAEILNALLGSDDVDKEQATNIFSILTGGLNYKFTKNNGKIQVTYNDKSDHRLLKTPEGIIEAKQLSLILAHKFYKTVCLEEPDLGMHPHMVGKLRDFVLTSDQEKVIIVISHNPAMVRKSDLDRIHCCIRVDTCHQVLSMRKFENPGLKLKEEIRNILFASNVLFVKGLTDQNCMQIVFEKAFSSTSDMKGINLNTQIISIDNSTSYKAFKSLVEYLKIPYVFLFDKNVAYTKDDTIDETKIKKNFQEKGEKDIVLKSFDDVQDYLNKKNIFIWKSGKTKDVIKNSIKTEQDSFDNTQRNRWFTQMTGDQKDRFENCLWKNEEIQTFLKFLKTKM